MQRIVHCSQGGTVRECALRVSLRPRSNNYYHRQFIEVISRNMNIVSTIVQLYRHIGQLKCCDGIGIWRKRKHVRGRQTRDKGRLVVRIGEHLFQKESQFAVAELDVRWLRVDLVAGSVRGNTLRSTSTSNQVDTSLSSSSSNTS